MMKQLLFLSAIVVTFSACLKSNSNSSCSYTNSTIVAPSSEISALKGYLSGNNSAALQDTSGIFYQITNPGTGTVTPGVCSTITASYVGKFTNGNTFDSSATNFSSVLGRLVVGWQKGLPYIKKGGSIKLYIPPSLGYGVKDVIDQNGVIVVPANSILIFNIQLLDVQ